MVGYKLKKVESGGGLVVEVVVIELASVYY
jgi:hypothetical protein